MARFGRGQPHQPIFLRGALAAAVVSSALAPQIHVVSLAADRRALPQERKARVVYLRPSRTSLVPDRLAPQLHIVQANPLASRHPAREADVLFLRNALVPPVVATPAPQIHVVSQAPSRGRIPPQHKGSVVLLRPSRTSLVPDRLAPQIHLVSVLDQRTPLPGRRAEVLLLRTAAVAPAAPSTSAPQNHTLLQPRKRAIPRGLVLQLHAPVIAAPPANSRIHVVTLAPERPAVQVPRRAHVVVVRPSPTSIVPARLAPQIHVLLQRRGTPPRTHIVILRGAQAAVAVLTEPVFLLDQGTERYQLIDGAGVAYELVEQSDGSYLLLEAGEQRYPLVDQSRPTTGLG